MIFYKKETEKNLNYIVARPCGHVDEGHLVELRFLEPVHHLHRPNKPLVNCWRRLMGLWKGIVVCVRQILLRPRSGH